MPISAKHLHRDTATKLAYKVNHNLLFETRSEGCLYKESIYYVELPSSIMSKSPEWLALMEAAMD